MTWNQLSFRHRLLIIMTLSGLVELLVLTWAGFAYIKHSQQLEMGEKALGIAQFLAQTPAVVEMVEKKQPNPMPVKLDNLTNLIGATFIVLGDQDGIRLTHPIKERVGKPMKGGDNVRALVHGESYVSFAEGSLGKSVRGKTPVFDGHGNIIGVISVGYLLDSLQDRIEPYLAFLIAMALLVVVANGVLSNYLSRRFQRAILGFEPEELARLYVEQDVTMSTIREGILSVDKAGVIRSINKSACEILGIDQFRVLNKPITQVLPSSDLMTVLATKQPQVDVELRLNGHHVVANRNPIFVEGEVVGVVSSFRPKDEITELTKKLAQTRQYADMLRSQTHEHRNKLNTISGLVQLGETDTVQQLIGQETERYQSLIGVIRETIKDPLVAGLLLGKSERAGELGVNLRIDQESHLDPLTTLRSDDLVTVLGNLIDNGFEALLHSQHSKDLMVSISDYGTDVILEVEDNGCGWPEDMSEAQLFERGVTSKQGADRGVGLHLVRQIVDKYHGNIEIGERKPNGARITVYLSKEGNND
ncbi:sensor histidine kinase [Vibrio sp. SCSIO 43136]|uniref:sensor histidine kinase n=1 Tax=Vibrio sp. SCSIO 43136 TaxID=2819101 RepID=UPI00207518F5|nr:sensor histidine kinase [Vibrio sp. SCSIO 43136]USD66478.1 sensor histidine kinase [Vibrio sp. SCSIO 43136]